MLLGISPELIFFVGVGIFFAGFFVSLAGVCFEGLGFAWDVVYCFWAGAIKVRNWLVAGFLAYRLGDFDTIMGPYIWRVCCQREPTRTFVCVSF